jgi:RNA polymerase sigma factor (sigma-70 family)
MSTHAETLIRAALSGDRAAGRVLERRLRPAIDRSIANVLRNRSRCSPGAADLAQGVWVSLLDDGGRRLLAYEAARGVPLESYIAMIAARSALNELQKHRAAKRGRKWVRVDLDFDYLTQTREDPEQAAISLEILESIIEIVRTELPPKALEVLRCACLDGNKPNDAAQILGLSSQAVRTSQMKIRRIAREMIAT